ncbi:MAG: hypothetical protein KDD44_10170 [Bdellovibrionales bacterium]|nr:hypothetical protein [Bdellovibrionales bacterium]
MPRLTFARFVLPAALLIGGVSACSDSNSDDGIVSANVVTIEVSDNVLAVGQASIVAADFSYSANLIFGEDKHVFVTIRIAPGLDFREGTSEIDGITSSDDESVGADITRCPESGEMFLVFDLDRFDLDSAQNPSGDADARLNFTVDAVAASPQSTISARADATPSIFACGEEFIPEAITVLQVVP